MSADPDPEADYQLLRDLMDGRLDKKAEAVVNQRLRDEKPFLSKLADLVIEKAKLQAIASIRAKAAAAKMGKRGPPPPEELN